MPTTTKISTIKGEVVRIVPPGEAEPYLRRKCEREIVKDKYFIVIEPEDPNMPKEVGLKWLWYILTHPENPTVLLMSVCPYKIGDIVEVDAVEVLIPSGFFTTEADRI